ncbi:MAG TPA: DUF11 domain-containing protein [Thermoanaerobaculia bacterium]|nr:DUF11 domain-containing protein [Thermoanaerobaculia bacterium]
MTPTRTPTPPPGTGADLIVSKRANTNPVLPGRPLTYLVSVVNAGPDTAVAVTLDDPLPIGTTFVSCTTNRGTCAGPPVGGTGTVTADLGDLGVGEAAGITIVVDVTVPSGNIVNTATATSSTPDPNPDNNHSTNVVSIGAGIPALSPPLAALLALLLAAAGVWFARRD